MSKAEDFIQLYKRTDNNIVDDYRPNGKQAYFPWLPYRDAEEAIRIAREEVIEMLRKKLPNLIFDVSKYGYIPYNCPDEEIDCVRAAEEFIEDFRKILNKK